MYANYTYISRLMLDEECANESSEHDGTNDSCDKGLDCDEGVNCSDDPCDEGTDDFCDNFCVVDEGVDFATDPEVLDEGLDCANDPCDKACLFRF